MNLTEAADLLKTALQRPVAYHRAFAQIAGKVSAGLMLSQAWYWTPRTNKEDGWFYKTRAEWSEETGMSRTEQETARKRLIKLGLLEEKLASMPAKMHFRVNTERLIALLVENPPTRMRKSRQAVGGKPANMNAEKPPTITESTAETTTKSTRERSAHALVMEHHANHLRGEMPDPAAQGAAAKWLLERYSMEAILECYERLSQETWRSGVTLLTVKKMISQQPKIATPKLARTYEWQGRYYALGETVSDDGQRYTIMGADGTPSKRWHTPEAFAMDKGLNVEEVKAGWL